MSSTQLFQICDIQRGLTTIRARSWKSGFEITTTYKVRPESNETDSRKFV